MQLVLLGLQVVEKPPNSGKARPALDHVVLLFICEIAERHVHPDLDALGRSRGPLQLEEPLASFGFGPGLDGAFVERQVQTLAPRACARRAVEAEEHGLGFHKCRATSLAFEFLAETEALARAGIFKDYFAGFAVSGFRGVDDPLVQIR